MTDEGEQVTSNNSIAFPDRITRQWLIRRVPHMDADQFIDTCDELRARNWTSAENTDIEWFLQGLLTPSVRREVVARGKA